MTDRRFRRYRLFGRWWELDVPRLLELWRVGLPIGTALTFEVTIFNAAAFLMGLVGETAGNAARRTSRRFASSSVARMLTPVTLPSGRAMLFAKPAPTKSSPRPTMGVVAVCAFR